MIVKPNQERTAAAFISVDAQQVEVVRQGEAGVEVRILRPDGGTTTVAVFSPDGFKVVMRLVGHEDDKPDEPDTLHAEQEVKSDAHD